MRSPAPQAPSVPFKPEPALARWRTGAVIWSVLLAALGYLAFSLWGGWSEVVDAARRVGFAGVVIALMLSLLNYGLRFMRWQAYLSALEHSIPWRASLRVYLAGFALTTTPGKAGETLRSLLLARCRVPYPRSLAAFLSERLSDLLVVLLLALVGVSLYPGAGPLLGVCAAIIMLGLLVFACSRLLQRPVSQDQKPSWLLRVLGHLLQILHEARRCHRPLLLLKATVLGLAAWGAEAWAFHLLLQGMGLEIPLVLAVFIYAISMLAGALSFMPGGIGGAEGAMVALLVMWDVPTADAVAATVLIRLTTLWFAVAIGAAALGRSNSGMGGTR